MKRMFAKLDRIEHNEQIVKDSDYVFLHHLQSALLLALREQGKLSPMQYRHAEEKLKQQRREQARRSHDQSS